MAQFSRAFNMLICSMNFLNAGRVWSIFQIHFAFHPTLYWSWHCMKYGAGWFWMNMVPHQMIDILTGFRQVLILGRAVWLHSPMLWVMEWQTDQRALGMDGKTPGTEPERCYLQGNWWEIPAGFLPAAWIGGGAGEGQGRGSATLSRLSSLSASRPASRSLRVKSDLQTSSQQHLLKYLSTDGAPWSRGPGVACSSSRHL